MFYRSRVRTALLVTLSFAAFVSLGLAGQFVKPANGPKSDQPMRLSSSEAGALGWDSAHLGKAFAFAASLSTDALMIVTDGEVVGAFGEIDARLHVHSIRKVFLSALIGQQVGSGAEHISLEATLQELGIDDSPQPLTALQKTASVRNLLMSLSGINHPAAADAGLTAERNRRLGAEENEPGKIWAYNNWDYNALTTIFQRRTRSSIAEAFKTGIAEPARMQDFLQTDVSYVQAPERSQHAAAMFHMSARDLALFGQLYLNKGVLNERRILARHWIERIHSEAVDTGTAGLRRKHGYLWWIPDQESGLPAGSYWAWGFGQQALLVIPAWRTVLVHLSDTSEFRRRFFRLVRNDGVKPEKALERLMLLCLQPVAEMVEFCAKDRFISHREFAELLRLIVNARREK